MEAYDDETCIISRI